MYSNEAAREEAESKWDHTPQVELRHMHSQWDHGSSDAYACSRESGEFAGRMQCDHDECDRAHAGGIRAGGGALRSECKREHG